MKRNATDASLDANADRNVKPKLESKSDETPQKDEKSGLLEEDDISIPSDTVAALNLLRGEWTVNLKLFVAGKDCPRLLLHWQLFSILHDRTQADREMDVMRRKNQIRLFKWIGKRDESAVMFTEDFRAKIEEISKRLPNSDSAADRKQVLRLFVDKLLPNHWDYSISRDKLIQLVYNEGKFQDSFKPDDAITFLIHCGLLLNYEVSGSYLLAIPDAGCLNIEITKARKEIVDFIKRRKFKEIMLKDLMKRKLKQSSRGMQFHFRDMVGGGLLKVVRTTLGDLVRLGDAQQQ